VNLAPDDLPENRTLAPTQPDAVPAWLRAPVETGQSSPGQSSFVNPESAADENHPSNIQPIALVPPFSPDPAWNGWDVLRLSIISLVALFALVFGAAPLLVRWLLYPHTAFAQIIQLPLVVLAGQSVAYLVVFAYMYVLVTRERGRPDFLAAIHWNWPSNVAMYVLAGLLLSVALQLLARLLPIPKELPIDNFFRTPAEAWAVGLLAVLCAPLMEELFFRGFLYPVLARSAGMPIAVLLTAVAFALLHGAQLGFSWGPVLVIFLVGIVLTVVRARKNSVAASVLIHMAYNGTITVAMFAATDGFRHLEKLNQ
jgi:uncharacterized protein